MVGIGKLNTDVYKQTATLLSSVHAMQMQKL